MKRFSHWGILTFLILFSIELISQEVENRLLFPVSHFNEQVVTYTGFNLQYSEEHEQARWVSYYLTIERVNGDVDRTDNFREDSSISTGTATLNDYRGSGYDRGHLAPAGDMTWSPEAMSESFFLSNMSPQLPAFNRGIWKSLESLVRDFAIRYNKIYVVTGPVLMPGLPTIGESEVSIPEFYYKVIIDIQDPIVKGIGFIMENQSSSRELQTFAVPIDQVEEITGLDFFAPLPDFLENRIESEVDFEAWMREEPVTAFPTRLAAINNEIESLEHELREVSDHSEQIKRRIATLIVERLTLENNLRQDEGEYVIALEDAPITGQEGSPIAVLHRNDIARFISENENFVTVRFHDIVGQVEKSRLYRIGIILKPW